MTNTKTITDFEVTWTADHEQYWQGHGIAFTDYTHCATGVGETLREAFEDALDDLAQQDIDVTWIPADNKPRDCPDVEMLAELTAQVPTLSGIDNPLERNIVWAYCKNHGENDCDCAVCAGEWHYYVSIDVKVEEE